MYLCAVCLGVFVYVSVCKYVVWCIGSVYMLYAVCTVCRSVHMLSVYVCCVYLFFYISSSCLDSS